jgi:hypothetical protein
MAKLEKQYPDFECVEYDYGDLAHREYYGAIHAHLKFADDIRVSVVLDFKEFLEYHKRKKSDCHKAVERIYADMRGWGSRYFEMIEILQEDDDIDLFELFKEYLDLTYENLFEEYEYMRVYLKERDRHPIEAVKESQINPNISSQNKNNTEEILEFESVEEEEEEEVEEDDDDEEEAEEEQEDDDTPSEKQKDSPLHTQDDDDDEHEETPYDRDRKKFVELVQEGTDDMYEALKTNFFPQMEYFQRRYPNKWKAFTETFENLLSTLETELIDEMMPQLNDYEYREFDLKYNSQKADMSEDDIPPDAR